MGFWDVLRLFVGFDAFEAGQRSAYRDVSEYCRKRIRSP